MKELFTTEEWEAVRCIPMQAFAIVAGVDMQPDPQEFGEYAGRMLRGGMTYKDPLHREVAQEFASDDLAKRMQKASEIEIDETKAILKSRLSTEQYQSFLGSVFIDAAAVARASGTPGEEVSPPETAMLMAFATKWDLDLEMIQKLFEEK